MEAGNLIPDLIDKHIPDIGRDLHQHLSLLIVVEEPPLLAFHQLHSGWLTSLASMRDNLSSRICSTYVSEIFAFPTRDSYLSTSSPQT
jgi:hypothetical protein